MPDETPKPEKPGGEPAAEREYIVLNSSDGVWLERGTAQALNAKAAIQRVVEELPPDARDGTFVAVASRSWQPLTRTSESVQKVTWT